MKRSLLFAAAIILAAVAPRTAGAVERQHHIGLGPSLSTLVIDDKSTASIGAGFALHYAYGLNDQFNLMVEVGSSVVAKGEKLETPETPRTRPATVDQATAGVGYVIDVLEFVPYIGLLGGAYRMDGGTLENGIFLPGFALALGLDYQLSRHWALGAAVRQHMFLTHTSTYPSYTTALLRVEYMWGF